MGTDMLLQHGLLPKRTQRPRTSVTNRLMRKLSDSLELIRTPTQFKIEEEMKPGQSMDGPILHQARSSPKETPKISVTKTSTRKLSDSSEPIRTLIQSDLTAENNHGQ